MATYEITSAVGAVRKELSRAQRTSSLFTEAPVLFGKVFRRGTKMLVGQADMDANKAKVEVLVKAGSISVRVIATEDSIRAEGEVVTSAPISAPEVTVSVSPVDPVKEFPVTETATPTAQPETGKRGKRNKNG